MKPSSRTDAEAHGAAAKPAVSASALLRTLDHYPLALDGRPGAAAARASVKRAPPPPPADTTTTPRGAAEGRSTPVESVADSNAASSTYPLPSTDAYRRSPQQLAATVRAALADRLAAMLSDKLQARLRDATPEVEQVDLVEPPRAAAVAVVAPVAVSPATAPPPVPMAPPAAEATAPPPEESPAAEATTSPLRTRPLLPSAPPRAVQPVARAALALGVDGRGEQPTASSGRRGPAPSPSSLEVCARVAGSGSAGPQAAGEGPCVVHGRRRRERSPSPAASPETPTPGAPTPELPSLALMRVLRLRGLPHHNRGLYAGLGPPPPFLTRSGQLVAGVPSLSGTRVRPGAWASLQGRRLPSAAGVAGVAEAGVDLGEGRTWAGGAAGEDGDEPTGARLGGSRHASAGSPLILRTMDSGGRTHFQWARGEGPRLSETGDSDAGGTAGSGRSRGSAYGSRVDAMGELEDVEEAVDRVVRERYGRALSAADREEAARLLRERRQPASSAAGDRVGKGADGGARDSTTGAHPRDGVPTMGGGSVHGPGGAVGGGGIGVEDGAALTSYTDTPPSALSGGSRDSCTSLGTDHPLQAVGAAADGSAAMPESGSDTPIHWGLASLGRGTSPGPSRPSDVLERTLNAQEAGRVSFGGGGGGGGRGPRGRPPRAGTLTHAVLSGLGSAEDIGRSSSSSGSSRGSRGGGVGAERGGEGDGAQGGDAGAAGGVSHGRPGSSASLSGVDVGPGAPRDRPRSASMTLPNLPGPDVAEDTTAAALRADDSGGPPAKRPGAQGAAGGVAAARSSSPSPPGTAAPLPSPGRTPSAGKRRPRGPRLGHGTGEAASGAAAAAAAAAAEEEGRLEMFLASFPESQDHVRLRRRAKNVLADLGELEDSGGPRLTSFSATSNTTWDGTGLVPTSVSETAAAAAAAAARKKEEDSQLSGFKLSEAKLREKFKQEALTTYADLVARRDRLRVEVGRQRALKGAFEADTALLSEAKTGDQYAVALTREVNQFAKEHNLSLRQIIPDDALMEGDIEEVAEGFLDRFWKGKAECHDAACQVTEEDLGFVDENVRAVDAQMQDLFYHEQGLASAIRLATVAVANIMSFHASLELEATCKECLYLFDRPRTLWPCGHTFCQQCLAGMYNKRDELICSECGSICEFGYTPNLSVELIANYQIVQATDTGSGASRPGSKSGAEAPMSASGPVQTHTIEGVLRNLLSDLLATQRGCSVQPLSTKTLGQRA